MSEVGQLIRRLEASMQETFQKIESIPDEYIDAPCRHICARGGKVWHLLTHNIDHERMHAGQIISARDSLRKLQRDKRSHLLAELYIARAQVIAALVGLEDADLDKPPKEGKWSIREVVEHLIYWDRNSIDDVAAQYREDAEK
jgi:uncharacterized damage-inducible protein DinB